MTERQEAESPWKQAIDQELSLIQSSTDSYDTPQAAIKALIDWHVETATDPRVNGGYALVPVSTVGHEEKKVKKNQPVVAWMYTDSWGTHFTESAREILDTIGIESFTPLTPCKEYLVDVLDGL